VTVRLPTAILVVGEESEVPELNTFTDVPPIKDSMEFSATDAGGQANVR
jgi:hypothetical protein